MRISDWSSDVCSSDLGILYFHRSRQALDQGARNMRLLESDGQEIRVVDVEEINSREPELPPSRAQIAGGILCPTDETGDSAKCTRALAAIVDTRGGTILTSTRFSLIERQGDRVARHLTDTGELSADAFVHRLGAELPHLAA